MNTPAKSPSRTNKLLAAAASLAIAGAIGMGAVTSGTAPVFAEAVRVDAPQAPGFADVVEKVSPAVVSVRVKSPIEPANDGPGSLFNGPGGGFFFDGPGMDNLPDDHPMKRFFREFRGDGPRAERRDQRRQERKGPQRMRPSSQGSGFFITEDGYLVTNNHVVKDGASYTVVLDNGDELDAKLIGTDERTDLAVLKVDSDRKFTYVSFADDSKIRVGDWVVAVGNPFGLGGTVTAGIVSARGRDIRAGPYDDFFQIDAPINRGNSGGPSFTLEGKVFGVNTAIFSPSGGSVGIGFAIPANLAKPVIDSLMKSGKVARGWLGVRIQSVSEEIAESLGLPETDGALVASVTPGGPAARSQIQAGDVILEFDGKDINRMRSLPRLVAETPIGKEAHVKLWRKGQQLDLTVVLGELPEDEQIAELGQPQDAPAPSANAKIEPLGITIASLEKEQRTQFGLADTAKGVVITAVDAGSTAAEESLKPGDLIVEVGQEEVSSPPEVTAKVNQAQQEGKKSILLLIDRQGDLRFVALRFKE